MLKQRLQQKLLQKLSPQQIQLMKLLQVPTVALEQRIKEELEINPALEEGADEEEEAKNEDDENIEEDTSSDEDEFDLTDYMNDEDDTPDYKLNANNTSKDDERKDIPYSGIKSFHDQLISQLGLSNIPDSQRLIAEHLIGNIDDDGYLRRELLDIVDDLAFSQNISTSSEELESLLKIIQTFDPPGTGARTLQECLLLQLHRKDQKNKDIRIATEIIEHNMEEFSKKHYDKIFKKLNITEEVLRGAMNEILKLNPKPGDSYTESARSNQQITPDFFIFNNDGILELTLNSRNAPELRISKTYSNMLQEYAASKDKKARREALSFVKQKLDSAKWFIDAIQQRQQTLLMTMEAIMNYQYNYFLEGDETKLKPMILKDIAEMIGLDISTVSRVANSKYVQTSFGTFLLKTFFSESLSTDTGEEVSTREVKKILEESIASENKKKPVTDEKLTKILKEKGYNIARRTVAKYREQLDIPVARMRKEL